MRVANTLAAFALLLASGHAIAANPESPFFLWQYFGLEGAVMMTEEPGRVQTFEANGRRSALVQDGRTIAYTWRPSKRELVSRLGDGAMTVWIFDEEGYVIETTYYFSSGGSSTLSTSYSGNPRVGRTTNVRSGDLSDTKVFDEAGRLVQYLAEAQRQDYVLDDKGNRIEYRRYEDEGTLVDEFRYEYEFDEHGNWVRKVEIAWVPALNRFSNTAVVTERRVSYY